MATQKRTLRIGLSKSQDITDILELYWGRFPFMRDRDAESVKAIMHEWASIQMGLSPVHQAIILPQSPVTLSASEHQTTTIADSVNTSPRICDASEAAIDDDDDTSEWGTTELR